MSAPVFSHSCDPQPGNSSVNTATSTPANQIARDFSRGRRQRPQAFGNCRPRQGPCVQVPLRGPPTSILCTRKGISRCSESAICPSSSCSSPAPRSVEWLRVLLDLPYRTPKLVFSIMKSLIFWFWRPPFSNSGLESSI